MNLVPSVITQNLGKTALLAQKSSPEILLAVGVVGMVGATVLACRATLKMNEILEEANTNIEKTDEALKHSSYTERDKARDVALVRYKTGVKIVRAYAPAVIIGGISIYCLTKSNGILRERNAALAAAYVALDTGFKRYRANVVDKYGEEVDKELRFGTTEIEVTDQKTGKVKNVKVVDYDGYSEYARFFDETCHSWQEDPEYNIFFLTNLQNHFNDILKSKGHVILHEVYDMLGIPRSNASLLVGWIYTGTPETDDYIDFGIHAGTTVQNRAFVNGREGAILLDFNVDGPIWDKV